MESDPKVSSIIQGCLQSFRHEILLENAKGIPIIQQHGAVDDNVPAFHSRRMRQILSHSGDQRSSKYVELRDRGHWFDGVMTTAPLAMFYNDILANGSGVSTLPKKFSIVVANPAEMGSRGGLTIDQLCTCDQLGKIHVEREIDENTWVLQTSNILRFHFCPDSTTALPQNLIVDSTPVNLPCREVLWKTWLVQCNDGSWRVSVLRRNWIDLMMT